MIRIIAPTAKLNTKFIKSGTVEGRYKVVQKLEEKFYNRIKRYKKAGKDSFEYISKAYNYVLEDRIALRVDKIPSSSTENSAVWSGHDLSKKHPEDVIGYLVKYRTDYPNEGFAGVRMDILMHESNHLFTNITNPKYVVRLNNVAKIDKNFKFMDFFITHFQSLMTPKECAQKTEELLKHIPEEQQVNVLQNFRYNLIKEITAYDSGNRYYERDELFKPKEGNDFCPNPVELMGMREKLADVTERLRKMLIQKRADIKSKVMLHNKKQLLYNKKGD